MTSPSTPLGCVAGQVNGPFVPAQADVTSQETIQRQGPPSASAACRRCPVLFAKWGRVREGLAVGGDAALTAL